jgi:translation elongation factor EF-G
LTPDEQAELAPHREQLLETLAEVDDQVMEAYLNETPIPADMLETAIRRPRSISNACPSCAAAP